MPIHGPEDSTYLYVPFWWRWTLQNHSRFGTSVSSDREPSTDAQVKYDAPGTDDQIDGALFRHDPLLSALSILNYFFIFFLLHFRTNYRYLFWGEAHLLYQYSCPMFC